MEIQQIIRAMGTFALLCMAPITATILCRGIGARAQNAPHAAPIDTLRGSQSQSPLLKIHSGSRLRHSRELLRLRCRNSLARRIMDEYDNFKQ